MNYQLANGFDGVILKDSADAIVFIPNDPDNSLWSAYQQWLGDGGTPEPAGGLSFVPSPNASPE